MDIQQPKLSQYSQLDQFKIIKNLGSGYQATVKLAEDPNGFKVAIKKYKSQNTKPQTIESQFKIIKNFDHQNIIKFIDSRANALYTKKDGTQYKCYATIIEYAGGGQLFDYIADSGKFSQNVTRSYFGQLMNGLLHMHNKGFVHRDLKPQNLLLSEQFELKIADFGFSCPTQGKNKNNILKSKLGTQGYMAPEIYQKKYNGEKTDIFAAGVILFTMHTASNPFQKATKNDGYYKQIVKKDYQKFWSLHQKYKGKGFCSDKFKDLFNKMVAYNPNERLSIVQIAQHPWVAGDICTYKEIKIQFEQRQIRVAQAINKRNKDEQIKKQNAKKNIQNQGDNMRNSRNSRKSQTGELNQFIEDIRTQIHIKRKLPIFEQLYNEDLVLKEELAYVIVELRNFLSNLQMNIHVDTEQAVQIIGLNKGQLMHLQNIQDNETNEILAQLTYEWGDEQEMIIEKLVIRFVFGKDEDGNVIIRCEREEGNWFNFRRVYAEIKKLFANIIIVK